MQEAIDAKVIAIALLLEARGFVAQSDDHGWPRRLHQGSPNDALVRAWEAHPLQNVVAREGFAIARRTLEQVTSSTEYEPVDSSKVLGALDAALAELAG
jgi:hypothetical protein